MEHADYLSRNPLSNSAVPITPVKPKPKTVNYVELHQGWLSVEQKRDAEIQDLIAKHNNNSFPETVGSTSSEMAYSTGRLLVTKRFHGYP